MPAICAAILAGMSLLAVGAVAFRMRLAHYAAIKEVQAEVARIQSRGEPITTDDFHAFHRVPAGTLDTNSHWLRVLSSFQQSHSKASPYGLPIVGGNRDLNQLCPDAPDSLLSAAEEYLAHHTDTLRLAHEVAGMDGECRYPIPFGQGFEIGLDHIQELRGLVRLLRLQARVLVLRGDSAGAVKSNIDMIAAAESLADQPTLADQLVRQACLGLPMAELEFLLNETQLSDEQLMRVQERLERIDHRRALTLGMFGARGSGYYGFQHISTVADATGHSRFGGPDGELTRPEDCREYLKLMNQIVGASRKPFPAALRGADQFDNQVKALAGSHNPLTRSKFEVTILQADYLPLVFQATARDVAQRDALRVAFAAERYRLKTGSFPARLSVLVPDFLPSVPADPYNGQPLRMMSMEGEIIIYSIGKDEKDDYGLEIENRAEPDIPVRVKLAKKTP